MIHLPEAIHVCETIDGLRLPHAEAPLFRRNGLGEEAANHVLRDVLLFADADAAISPFRMRLRTASGESLNSLANSSTVYT
jgi:hypothetical protein